MATLNLVGSSAKFRALLDNVDLVAPVDSAVLIQGETGTGKEVIARAIHEVSPRRRNRFVALNCAAIPSALLESELFGYEKGAFTGAANQTIGRFQVADRGTLFLDEIGDLPLELQPKLLRALQEKQFERLGGSQTLQIDVRVIAATNQDLGQMVRERRFRADLYYRLNVFPMTLPPLRERRDDIALLTEYFVRKFAGQQGKVVATIPRDVMAALEHYDWPGNIRELQNVIERGVIMTTGLCIESADHRAFDTRRSCAGSFSSGEPSQRASGRWPMPSVRISPQHFGRPIGLSVGQMEQQRNWGCREQPCWPECSGLEFPIYPEDALGGRLNVSCE